MKTVSFILTYDYSLKTWFESGTLQRELEVFKKIAESKKYKFKFFSYGTNDDCEYYNDSDWFEVIPIYENIRYRKNKIFRFFNSFYIPFKIYKMVKDSDLIYQNQLNGAWVSIILKAITKKPLIIRTGYDAYLFSIIENKKIWIIQFYKLLTFLALKFSNLYTVTSISDSNFLHSKFNNPKIKITRNWTSVNQVVPINKRLNNKILCVGRLVEQKNYEYLINEFKLSKNNLEIDIIGEGHLKSKLLKLSNINQLKINFIGNVKHDQLLKIYQNYKFYILPSLYEGNPKTLLEAMGSGCIVLASNIENNLEVISDKVTGFIFDLKQGHLFNLYENISTLNENNLDIIQKKAVAHVEEFYSLKVIMKEILSDFESLTD